MVRFCYHWIIHTYIYIYIYISFLCLFIVYAIREAGIENLKKLVDKFNPKWGEVIVSVDIVALVILSVNYPY